MGWSEYRDWIIRDRVQQWIYVHKVQIMCDMIPPLLGTCHYHYVHFESFNIRVMYTSQRLHLLDCTCIRSLYKLYVGHSIFWHFQKYILYTKKLNLINVTELCDWINSRILSRFFLYHPMFYLISYFYLFIFLLFFFILIFFFAFCFCIFCIFFVLFCFFIFIFISFCIQLKSVLFDVSICIFFSIPVNILVFIT